MKRGVNKKITSLIEFLQWIDSCKKQCAFEQKEIFYRGQANVKWGFVPSVFRNENGNFCNETDLIIEAQNKCWKWIQDCSSELEQIIKFQHFGLNTRLLDITMNPLVALYFACDGQNKEDDGVVRYSIAPKGNISFAMLIAKIITNNLLGNCDISDEKLLTLAKDVGIDNLEAKAIKDELTKPHIICYPYNNERIANQQGAFIIAPLYNKKETFLKSEEIDLADNKYKIFEDSKAIIESKSKQKILRKLSEIGISENYLFPDFEHTLKSISKNAKKNTYNISDGN